MRTARFIACIVTLIFFSYCKKDKPEPTQNNASSEHAITGFSFLKEKNPALEADYNGTISGTAISVSIPHGTDITQLKATFTASAKASVTVGTTAQTSGSTANDFTNPVTYTVSAEDHSTAAYTVTVSKTGTPNAAINQRSSAYIWTTNYVHTNLSQIVQSLHGGYWGDEFLAQAFYDFDKDGDKDLICGSFNFDANTPLDLLFYRNNGGVYQKDQTVFTGTVPGYVHARKAVLGDFDNNGWMDVVIAGHGWDKVPFPGEQQKILLNNNGHFTVADLPLPKAADGNFGFNHSACAGDVDNDGDVDLFFTDNKGVAALFLRNNGQADFTYDPSVFADVIWKPSFTSELYDLDADGYLDLLIGGHDRDMNLSAEQGLQPTIFWGDHTGKYTAARSTKLPVVQQYGVTLNFSFADFDKDGKTDILAGKTGDGSSLSFYQGYYLQLLKNNGSRQFTDASNSIKDNTSTSGKWMIWMLPQDVDGDGDIDITTADKWYNQQWRNDNGTFIKY